MTAEDKLERYLKFNNLKLEESRIAGEGNYFRVLHCYPGSRRVRCLGDFMMYDQDCVSMGTADIEAVSAFLMGKTREIVDDCAKKSFRGDNDMLLRAVFR